MGAMVSTLRVLDVKGLSKSFPGVKALEDVEIYVKENEIVGLIGENGAGKSTFQNILCGLYPPDEGNILLHGQSFYPKNYYEASLKGISRVYQEQALVPNVPVYENMFISHERLFIKFGFYLDKSKMVQKAAEIFDSLGVEIAPTNLTESYDFSTRQIIEICRACSLSRLLGISKPLILLDEPTSALTQEQIEVLFSIIRKLKDEASFVFVAHRLTEVMELSDRIYVLKDGKITATIDDPKTQNEDTLHKYMVGREKNEDYYKEKEQKSVEGNTILEINNYGRKDTFKNISFKLMEGEILGFGGVLGSGKSELGKAIAGLMKKDVGELALKSNSTRIMNKYSFRDLMDDGFGYVPAERNLEGIITNFSVNWNISLASMNDKILYNFGMLDLKKERSIANKFIEEMGIKTPSANTQCLSLSGGNQQKVLLSKWLCRNPKILILDNPTRGVDAGAKEEIYEILRRLVTFKKMSIILISDELLELIGMSNRIIIMKDGVIRKEVIAAAGSKPTEETLVRYMV